jgi:hypothetical protein
MWCYDPALFRRRSRAAHNEEALSSYFQAPQLLRYRRYTRDKCVRRDVIYNKCACGHYGTVCDFDIAKHHTMCTQPNIVADHYRTGLMALDPVG